MNASEVISEAWKVTLNRKYLWIFGFIAALTFGNEAGVSLTQGGAWLFQNIGTLLGTQGLTTLIGVVISIFLWLLGILARIALIQNISVGESETEQLWSNVKDLFQSSIPAFSSIILMQFLVWSPIIIANILLFIGTRSLTESFTSSFDAGNIPDFNFSSFGLFWTLGISVSLLTIPLLFIDAFSYRSIVIERLGVIDGVKRAISIIKENIKPILSLAALCTIIGIAFSFVVSLILSPLLLVMMPLMRQVVAECTTTGNNFEAMAECMQRLNQQPSFIGLLLVSSVLSAALSSVWVAFQSITFTLAYRKLTKKRGFSK